MSADVIIIDDSALNNAIVSLRDFSYKRITEYDALAQDLGLDRTSNVLVHLSYGALRRTSALGIEVAQSLRRDHRYDGKIQLYSLQSFDSLAKAHPFMNCVRDTELKRWNISFFTLPEDGLELARTVAASEPARLADKELTEFVLRFCGLDRYFSRQLGNVAHRFQRENWHEKFDSIAFKQLLQNIKDFGPSFAMRRRLAPTDQAEQQGSGVMPAEVKAAVALLEDAALGKRLREAVGAVQDWLYPKPAVAGPAPADEALQGYNLILLADDDIYDSQQLERLGYRVEHLDEISAVREFLKDEEPSVFLCDLTWHGNPQTGLQLAREATELGVRIVILMSVGPIESILPKESLPKAVIVCEGVTNKQDAAYIHSLIVRRAQEIEDNQDDPSLSTR